MFDNGSSHGLPATTELYWLDTLFPQSTRLALLLHTSNAVIMCLFM